MVVLGDFNLPDINWSSLSAASGVSQLFCDCMFSADLMQLIEVPTHVFGNTLDLLMTNNPGDVSDLSVDSSCNCGLSDHYMIWFSIKVSFCTQLKIKPKIVHKYHQTDVDGLVLYLSSLSYPQVLPHDINGAWVVIKSFITEARDTFVPSVHIPSKPSPPWFSPLIRHNINRVRFLRRRLRAHPSCSRLRKLHLAEENLREQITLAKDGYISRMTQQFFSSPRQLYSYMSQLTRSSSIPQSVFLERESSTTPFGKATLFNQYFNSVFTNSSYKLPSLGHLPSPETQLCKISISSSDVSEVLQTINITKAPGADDLSPFLIKLSYSVLLSQFTSLFGNSLMYSSFPSDWKVHKISPVFKGKGDPSNVSNYRPISLLSIVSKILERVVYNKVIEFIRPKLSVTQFGFLKHRSCVSQLLSSFAVIFDALDNKLSVDEVFFDFSKAFDTVPHQELLFKLWRIGITGPLWKWFRSYLSDRHHYTCIEGSASQLLPVKSGVPQGSVLGPLLFLIYVNDIPSRIHSQVFTFADDTKFLQSINSFHESAVLQEDISSLSDWCSEWSLNLNVTKCCHISFSFKSVESNTYYISNDPVSKVESHRDLGVIVSSDLSWSSHYSKICKSAYTSLHLIKRTLTSSTDVTLKKSLYLALVRSKLSYCCQLWSPRTIKDITVLERIQRRATKYLLSTSSPSYKDRLIELHILPLMYWFDFQDILFLVRSILFPSDNFDIFSYVSFCPPGSRSGSSGKLYCQYHRLSTTRHFYFARVVRLWNNLPQIDLSKSFYLIKKQIYNYLWSHFMINFDLSPHSYHFVCPCSSCFVS